MNAGITRFFSKYIPALVLLAASCGSVTSNNEESELNRRKRWQWGSGHALNAEGHRKAVRDLTKQGNTLVLTLKRKSSGNQIRVYEHGRLIKTIGATIGKRSGGRFSLTPSGLFSLNFYSRYHRSSKYNNAYMHYAMFFNGGVAMHASKDITDGGRRSHGCIRLKIPDARWLWARAHKHRSSKIRILIYR